MAELSMGDSALLQYRLANEHRISLVRLNNMTGLQLYRLFDALSGQDDKTITRGVRKMFPVVMEERGAEAAMIGAALYNESRNIYAQTKGAAKAVNSTYVAQPSTFLNTEAPRKVIQERMDEVGFHIGEVFQQEKPIRQVRTQMVQIAQRAPLDIATQEIKFDMGLDDAAKTREPKRIANGQGCPFCKHMAVFVGVGDEWAGNFHKGCSCTPQPAWRNEMDFRPAWADEHEEAYYTQRDAIDEKNARLIRKQRRVQTSRINSKGNEVTEWKQETYFIDPETGKESTPESTSIRHILATMPRA